MLTPSDVRDLKIEEGPQFDPRGHVVNVRMVTFWVGDHGPFRLTDPDTVLTSAVIKARIQAKLDELNDVLNMAGPQGA